MTSNRAAFVAEYEDGRTVEFSIDRWTLSLGEYAARIVGKRRPAARRDQSSYAQALTARPGSPLERLSFRSLTAHGSLHRDGTRSVEWRD
jgi:hypothetical protein